MFDPSPPTSNRSVPDPHVIIDAHVLPKDFTTPAVVIARDHQHGNARLPQVRKCGENAKARTRNDSLPLEPEFEEIAVDYQRPSAPAEMAKKIQNFVLDGWLREAEVQIRNDVSW